MYGIITMKKIPAGSNKSLIIRAGKSAQDHQNLSSLP
jgi:hypothetical protein